MCHNLQATNRPFISGVSAYSLQAGMRRSFKLLSCWIQNMIGILWHQMAPSSAYAGITLLPTIMHAECEDARDSAIFQGYGIVHEDEPSINASMTGMMI